MQIHNAAELAELLRQRAIVATNVTIVFENGGGARLRVDGDAAAALAELPDAVRALVAAAKRVKVTRLDKPIAAVEAILARMEGGHE
jgi:hypothetical protein